MNELIAKIHKTVVAIICPLVRRGGLVCPGIRKDEHAKVYLPLAAPQATRAVNSNFSNQYKRENSAIASMKNLKNSSVCIIPILLCVLAGCSTPRTEPLPEGPKGDSIVGLTQCMKSDESPTIRVASALSLGKIGNRYPDLELIDTMYNDPSIQVKMAAIRSLGQLGGERSLKSLNEYYLSYSGSGMGIPEKAVLEELKSAMEKAGKTGGGK